jgi:hypothetical protein
MLLLIQSSWTLVLSYIHITIIVLMQQVNSLLYIEIGDQRNSSLVMTVHISQHIINCEIYCTSQSYQVI